MAIEITWDPIYSAPGSGQQITPEIARNVIYLMRMTGKVHDRDFGKVGSLDNFVTKINTRYPKTNLNWIKVSLGTDKTTKLQVAIIYHLLRHRLDAPGRKTSAWSVSVGADPFLLQDRWKRKYNPRAEDVQWPNNDNPYLQLLKEFNIRIKKDLGSFVGQDPVAPQFTIYDEIDRYESINDPAGKDPHDLRRNTGIGELGWVAQNANPAHLGGTAFSSVSTQKLKLTDLNAPVTWGRPAQGSSPADEYIVETVVTI